MWNQANLGNMSVVSEAIKAIAGLCLVLSPWVLGFADMTAAAWNAWAVGLAMIAVAAWAYLANNPWLPWGALALGVWAIVAPWGLAFSGTANALIVHVLAGGVVTALAVVDLLWTNNRSASTA